jgi:hypothetical protein
MGPRAGLDGTVNRKIFCPCRDTNPGCPVLVTTIRTEDISWWFDSRPTVSWLKLLLSRLVFGRGSVWTSAGAPTALVQIFVVFLSHSKQVPGYYLKLGKGSFFPNPFQFIIHYHSTPQTELLTASLNKQWKIPDRGRFIAFRQTLRRAQSRVLLALGFFPLAVKRPGRESDHSSASSAEVKRALNCNSTPSIRLHKLLLSVRDKNVLEQRTDSIFRAK